LPFLCNTLKEIHSDGMKAISLLLSRA